MDPVATAEKLPALAKGLGGMLVDPLEVFGLLLIIIALLVVALWYVFKLLLAAHRQLVEKLDKVEKLAEMVTRSAATQGSASDRMVSVSDRVAEAILVLAANQEAS